MCVAGPGAGAWPRPPLRRPGAAASAVHVEVPGCPRVTKAMPDKGDPIEV